MSSYIIDKEDYVRMAGAIAGICMASKYPDRETIDSILFDTEEVYQANVRSYNIQYGVDEKCDNVVYDKLYYEYMNYTYCLPKERKMELMMEIIEFIRSILYQIDDEKLYDMARFRLTEMIFMMHRAIYPDSTGFWGKFNLDLNCDKHKGGKQ